MLNLQLFLEFKAMAYADLEDVKAFYKTYNECLKELGLPKSKYYMYYNI
jgi:hypothetical protein